MYTQYNYNGWQQNYRYDTPVELERKELRRTVNVLCTALCLSNIIVNFLSIAVVLAAMLVSDMTYVEAADFLYQPFPTIIQQAVFSVLLFTVPFIIAAKILRFRIGDLIPSGRLPAPLFAALTGVGLMAAMAANIINSAFVTVFGLENSGSGLSVPDGAAGTALWIVVISAFPALVEEFAMRGVVLGTLRRFGDGIAILGSAAIFGIMHGNFVQMPFAFMLGLVLGYFTVVTGSVRPAVTIHFINNFMSCVLQLVPEGYAYEAANAIYFTVAVLLGIIGLIYICRHYRRLLSFRDRPSALMPREKRLAFFGSGGMIFCYILFGFSALIMMFAGAVNNV
jgi:membrane protease YdiL (CAAX protease family)